MGGFAGWRDERSRWRLLDGRLTHDAPGSGEGAGWPGPVPDDRLRAIGGQGPPEGDEALLRRVKLLGLAIEIMCFDSIYILMSSLSTRIPFYVEY